MTYATSMPRRTRIQRNLLCPVDAVAELLRPAMLELTQKSWSDVQINNLYTKMFFLLCWTHQNIFWWTLKRRGRKRTWITQLTFNVTHITLPIMMNDWLTTNFEEERSICLSKQTIDWIVLYIRPIICWKVQTDNSSINYTNHNWVKELKRSTI